MKTTNSLIFALTIILLTLHACSKDDSEPMNHQPDSPTLISPANEESVEPTNLTFHWEEGKDPEGDSIRYDLYLSVDGQTWDIFRNIKQNSFKMENQLERSKKYYWKLKAQNYFPVGVQPANIENKEVFSETSIFYSANEGISQLKTTEIKERSLSFSWEEPEVTDYIEITISSDKNETSQKVEKGTKSITFDQLEPNQIYTISFKLFDNKGIYSLKSIREMPLDTSKFVRDPDFNIYEPRQIGDQIWITEPIISLHYWDGTEISKNRNREYGHEYQHYTIQKHDIDFVPKGFKAANTFDWEQLEVFLGKKESNLDYWQGEETQIGKKLKSKTGWKNKPNGESGNGEALYGFDIKPIDGEYCYIILKKPHWTDNRWPVVLFSYEHDGIAGGSSTEMSQGLVFCVKNTN